MPVALFAPPFPPVHFIVCRNFLTAFVCGVREGASRRSDYTMAPEQPKTICFGDPNQPPPHCRMGDVSSPDSWRWLHTKWTLASFFFFLIRFYLNRFGTRNELPGLSGVKRSSRVCVWGTGSDPVNHESSLSTVSYSLLWPINAARRGGVRHRNAFPH